MGKLCLLFLSIVRSGVFRQHMGLRAKKLGGSLPREWPPPDEEDPKDSKFLWVEAWAIGLGMLALILFGLNLLFGS